MEKYLNLAESVALEAGRVMMKYFRQGMAHRFKKDQSIVTQTDEEINRLVIARITSRYPSHSVLGEEASRDKKSNLVWLCDPVDGTLPYAKGLPVAVFSLALVDSGQPLLGVVYDPFTDRLYSAVKGRGAYLNKKRMTVSKLGLKDATINIEWWPEADYDIDGAMHDLSLRTKAYVLHLGSVVNAACLVSAGQYEACIYAGTRDKSVDVAAVKVIVEEAGGQVTDLFGNQQLFIHDLRGAIVSNGVVHNEILAYTQRLKR